MDVGVNPNSDYLLDPQQAEPAGHCAFCGGEVYGDHICMRCERRARIPDDEEDDDDE